ncbi:MAG: transcription elongation factor GreA [Actinomycetota bacterium]|nr:transcription elongation factor GreA [Actinomycetota bacterium]
MSSATVEPSSAPTTWLTQDAYDRLRAELDKLIAARPAMSAEINARRQEGDLKENGGYHAAKEEQGKAEARILQLSDILRGAEVGDPPDHAESAALGTVVTVRFVGDDDTEKFLLGSREISGTTDLTVYSPESALGKAIIDKKVGQSVTYAAPNGNEVEVEIIALEIFRI